jgi:hypothetical protein
MRNAFISAVLSGIVFVCGFVAGVVWANDYTQTSCDKAGLLLLDQRAYVCERKP